jgi:hypothetical protein
MMAMESMDEHGKTDFTAVTHDCREKVNREPVERLTWVMQELGHQKQALQAMQGAIAERTQRKILIEKRSSGAG